MEHKNNLFGSLPRPAEEDRKETQAVGQEVGRQDSGPQSPAEPIVADLPDFDDVRDLPEPAAPRPTVSAISEDAVQRIYLAYASAAGYMGDFYSESAGFQRGFRLALEAAFNEGLRHG